MSGLFLSDLARSCHNQQPQLSVHADSPRQDYVEDWFNAIRLVLSPDELALVVMSCWNLWGSRNRMVHEGAVFYAPQLFRFTQQNSDKYAEAHNFFASPRPPDQEIVWTPPPAGTIKINFDGAIHSTTGSAGLGIIARDSTGTIIAWQRIHVPFQTNPTITEALAALTAIRLAFQFQFSIIQVEGDCLQVIRQLQSSDLSLTSDSQHLHHLHFVFEPLLLRRGRILSWGGERMLP